MWEIQMREHMGETGDQDMEQVRKMGARRKRQDGDMERVGEDMGQVGEAGTSIWNR
jgi:hypothetical protein